MAPVLAALLGASIAAAAPHRGEPVRPRIIDEGPGRNPHRLIVKLAENRGFSIANSRIIGPKPLPVINELLEGSQPLFSRHARSTGVPRSAGAADLSLYRVISSADAALLGNRLLNRPEVETAYLAPQPVPPPADIPPETPDFSFDQLYDQPGPDGFGFDRANDWPGGDGRNVMIADVEYGFDPMHEDLTSVTIDAFGPGFSDYQFHGNGVLGVLAAPDNGYGITGLVPAAPLMVVSPFSDPETYNVADAIDMAASMLTAGDVLLIQQQGWRNDTYTPVEVEPAVFDAIAAAVAAGIVVIEPAGNGACDLDDPIWEDAFNRAERDSGAIMVGGGASPLSGFEPRSYHPIGSCYGDRVDVQGWYDHMVTLSARDGAPSFTDLFFPEADGRQAYTGQFGGTSGAAPLVAAIAAVMNSVAIETGSEPWDPLELRAVLSSTGHPQTGDGVEAVGPQPDLRRLLRIYGVR